MAATLSNSTLRSFARGSEGYEERRTRFFNARRPSAAPAEIACPTTTADVVVAIERANARGWKVGVRSGGHLFTCSSLQQDGLLIDTSLLNRSIDYDSNSQTISFGPATLSKDFVQPLEDVGRFFPFGHSTTVGVGGFLLAGGQGWFGRGWGCTADSWVTQLEIVVPDGRALLASQTQNQDLFWAARGSGQGFFGVVTRIWGKTIPAEKLFDAVLVFDVTEAFNSVMAWAFEAADKTPKDGVDICMLSFYADRDRLGGDVVQDKKVLLSLSLAAYAGSISAADTILSAYLDVPDRLRKYLVAETPTKEIRWQDIWDLQNDFFPPDGSLRWQCDSILSDPKVSREQLVEAIRPCMVDLPSRRSVGTINVLDYYPDERNQVISIPQQYYISTMTCWKDASWDSEMRNWMLNTYNKLDKLSLGQYIADLDVTHRIPKIFSDTALARWLRIRRECDPEDMFPSYKGFADKWDQTKLKSIL